LHLPLGYVLLAIGLVFLFLMVNGISQGISDSNPISSAFVIAVFIMATVGLKDPGVGLLCAAILLISCSVGVDMQQDRSTGWRLGTNRIIQFRYQVIGVFMGAVLCVVLAKLFMNAYPVLRLDQYSGEVAGAEKWQSAMTYKFVGALQGLTNPSPIFGQALGLGITLGVLIESARKALKRHAGYKAFVGRGRAGFATDFCVDAFLLPSPYASSFGGFVNLPTTLWFALGGVTTSVAQTVAVARPGPFCYQARPCLHFVVRSRPRPCAAASPSGSSRPPGPAPRRSATAAPPTPSAERVACVTARHEPAIARFRPAVPTRARRTRSACGSRTM
jgi:hypothetical protein